MPETYASVWTDPLMWQSPPPVRYDPRAVEELIEAVAAIVEEYRESGSVVRARRLQGLLERLKSPPPTPR